MKLLNQPVNFGIQMILVFLGAIVGPSFHIISNMEFIKSVLGISVFTMVIPLILSVVFIIPFGLIQKLKHGIILFLFLYLSPVMIFYFVGSFAALFAQNIGLSQQDGANFGVVSTIGVFAIMGMITMYYVAKWSDEWNRKFSTM
jgi:hypothetical protein